MDDTPLVSIIIPHYNGVEMLRECLRSLSGTTYSNFETIIVDNASTDGSVKMVESEFSSAKLIKLNSNKGYAGGCNAGILASEKADYIVLFNNDVKVSPDWLSHLVKSMEEDKGVAACQPKILSIADESMFDYSGAAGGLMDKYAYPFARGRIIATIERDEGQYDQPVELFWASGTACILRKSSLDEVGILDELFFAHMEEIDLNWRLHLKGYKIRFVPESVIYHQSGATLSAEKFKKKYLNHRNSMIMMIKNYSMRNLIKLLPARIFIELLALGYSLMSADFNRFIGIIAALLWLLTHPVYLFRERKVVQKLREVSDEEIMKDLYGSSIALSYYLLGKKKVSDL